VTVLAHDLRNHLSPLALRLYSLQQRTAVDQRNDDLDDVSVALQSVSRISHLISDLLDVARIDKGLFHLDLEPADLTQLAHDAASTMTRREHEIHITATGPMIAWADAGRLRQCLENLMTNAINHSPAGAPVHVFVSEVQRDNGQWARIEIRDEGPGIPDEMKPHLFERFHTGGKQRGGLGLGLYLARRIANAHGGDVETELNRATGARFIITLPRHQPGDQNQ
jgi:two-component system, OmpR family, sensor kinase